MRLSYASQGAWPLPWLIDLDDQNLIDTMIETLEEVTDEYGK